jgi:hypothetical protein
MGTARVSGQTTRLKELSPNVPRAVSCSARLTGHRRRFNVRAAPFRLLVRQGWMAGGSMRHSEGTVACCESSKLASCLQS